MLTTHLFKGNDFDLMSSQLSNRYIIFIFDFFLKQILYFIFNVYILFYVLKYLLLCAYFNLYLFIRSKKAIIKHWYEYMCSKIEQHLKEDDLFTDVNANQNYKERRYNLCDMQSVLNAVRAEVNLKQQQNLETLNDKDKKIALAMNVYISEFDSPAGQRTKKRKIRNCPKLQQSKIHYSSDGIPVGFINYTFSG